MIKDTTKAHENKRLALLQLGGCCAHCGINDIRVLQFDHIEPEHKTNEMSRLFRRGSKRKIAEELRKCQLLCANCHQIKTIEEKDYERNRPQSKLLQPLAPLNLYEGKGICPWCGNTFEIPESRPNKKWCSAQCKKRFADAQWRRRKREQELTL